MTPKARPPKSYKKLRLSYKKLRESYEKLRQVTKSYNLGDPGVDPRTMFFDPWAVLVDPEGPSGPKIIPKTPPGVSKWSPRPPQTSIFDTLEALFLQIRSLRVPSHHNWARWREGRRQVDTWKYPDKQNSKQFCLTGEGMYVYCVYQPP